MTLSACAQIGTKKRADTTMGPLTCPILPDRQANFALSSTRGLRAMTSFGVSPDRLHPTQLLSLAVKGSGASPELSGALQAHGLFSWNVLEQLVVVTELSVAQ